MCLDKLCIAYILIYFSISTVLLDGLQYYLLKISIILKLFSNILSFLPVYNLIYEN